MGLLNRILSVIVNRRIPLEEIPEPTFVDVRSLGSVPAKFWTARVEYDPWGTPYITGGYFHRFTKHELLPTGYASDYPAKLQWRLNSGPEVTFSDKNPDDMWSPQEAKNG